MDLYYRFLGFANFHKLKGNENTTLLAVSGGVDSMVMAQLYIDAKFKIAIAHCNFSLRGSESDADEQLVCDFAKQHNIPIYVKHFDTDMYAKQEKISIQMAARDLRYKWFNQLIAAHNYKYIATAHHADDQVETFFINALRGSGIKGLVGITADGDTLIRPLIHFTKQELLDYAAAKHIAFRNDSSNDKDDYLRNKIRHHLLPQLNQIQADASVQISASITNLKDDEKVLEELTAIAFESFSEYNNKHYLVDIHKLKKYSNFPILWYYYAKQFGFNREQSDAVLTALTGRIFYSHSHKVLVDRSVFIIEEIQTSNSSQNKIVYPSLDELQKRAELSAERLPISDCNYKNAQACETFFDAAKTNFPWLIRNWEMGDKMIPLGMKGQKKISDILIDNKVDNFTKEQVKVLVNANQEIIWLIGYTTSNSFKIDASTTEVVHLVCK